MNHANITQNFIETFINYYNNCSKIHQENDILMEEILFNTKNLSDEKIVIELFNKYEACINNENKELF